MGRYRVIFLIGGNKMKEVYFSNFEEEIYHQVDTNPYQKYDKIFLPYIEENKEEEENFEENFIFAITEHFNEKKKCSKKRKDSFKSKRKITYSSKKEKRRNKKGETFKAAVDDFNQNLEYDYLEACDCLRDFYKELIEDDCAEFWYEYQNCIEDINNEELSFFDKFYQSGYLFNYTDDFKKGFEAACKFLYNNRYNEGFNIGYDEGFYNGHKSGYEEGFNDGYKSRII